MGHAHFYSEGAGGSIRRLSTFRSLPYLAHIREGVHCLYCGTGLSHGHNWDKSSREYVCHTHRHLLRKSNDFKKWFCRLCGRALSLRNWSSFLSVNVCLACLSTKTSHFGYLYRTTPDIAKPLQSTGYLLACQDVVNQYDPADTLKALVACEEYIAKLYEKDLQSLLAYGLERMGFEVELEVSLGKCRIDLVIRSLKLAVELKRRLYSDGPKTRLFSTQCQDYHDALFKHEGHGWTVVLVSPEATVPNSLSIEQLFTEHLLCCDPVEEQEFYT